MNEGTSSDGDHEMAGTERMGGEIFTFSSLSIRITKFSFLGMDQSGHSDNLKTISIHLDCSITLDENGEGTFSDFIFYSSF